MIDLARQFELELIHPPHDEPPDTAKKTVADRLSEKKCQIITTWAHHYGDGGERPFKASMQDLQERPGKAPGSLTKWRLYHTKTKLSECGLSQLFPELPPFITSNVLLKACGEQNLEVVGMHAFATKPVVKMVEESGEKVSCCITESLPVGRKFLTKGDPTPQRQKKAKAKRAPKLTEKQKARKKTMDRYKDEFGCKNDEAQRAATRKENERKEQYRKGLGSSSALVQSIKKGLAGGDAKNNPLPNEESMLKTLEFGAWSRKDVEDKKDNVQKMRDLITAMMRQRLSKNVDSSTVILGIFDEPCLRWAECNGSHTSLISSLMCYAKVGRGEPLIHYIAARWQPLPDQVTMILRVRVKRST
jgi:hypothetical protein